MKKMFALALVLVLGLVSVPVSAAPKYAKYDYSVRVTVNSVLVKSDVRPFIDVTNSRMYVPIRFVSLALGERIEWNNKAKTVTVITSNKKVVLSPGKKYAIVNGVKQSIDAPIVEVSNRIMVPLRFVSEQMGATVTSKKENGWTTVNIAYPNAPNGKEEKKQDNANNMYSTDFQWKAGYTELAKELFVDNMKVVNGKLTFTLPKGITAQYYAADGASGYLTSGKTYTYSIGRGSGFVSFSKIYPGRDEQEGYVVNLDSSFNEYLDALFGGSSDAIVTNAGNFSAAPLSEVQKLAQNHK